MVFHPVAAVPALEGGVAGGDPDIPRGRCTFGAPMRAQAAGDLVALCDRGRRAARVSLAELLRLGR